MVTEVGDVSNHEAAGLRVECILSTQHGIRCAHFTVASSAAACLPVIATTRTTSAHTAAVLDTDAVGTACPSILQPLAATCQQLVVGGALTQD